MLSIDSIRLINKLTTLRIVIKLVIFFLLIFFTHTVCIAQKKSNKKNSQPLGLFLEKKIPVYVDVCPQNICNTQELIVQLRDSLLKEGFILIDSTKRRSLQNSFVQNDLFNPSKIKGKGPDELKAYLDATMYSKKINQELLISNNSCVDTLHNYTITVYLYPRPRSEQINLSFTLPFNSPARILDVILSLIEREVNLK